MRSRIAAAIVALSLLTACSHKAGSGDSAGADASRSTTDESLIASGHGVGSSDGAEAKTAGGLSDGARSDTDPPQPSQAVLDTLPPDWIAGKPSDRNPDDPMLTDCRLKRGEVCKIRVQGYYRLSTAEAGRITAAVYEDDAPAPAQTAGQGLPVPKGGMRWYVYVPYRVSATAKSITVEAVLLGPDGKPLFRGERHTYKIP